MEVNLIPRHFSRQNVSSRNQSFPSTSLYHHSFPLSQRSCSFSVSLPLSLVYEFPKAPVTNYHKSKVWAGLVPSGGCEGESVPCFSPSFWLLLSIFDVPWLVGASIQPVSTFTWPSLLCLCIHISL